MTLIIKDICTYNAFRMKFLVVATRIIHNVNVGINKESNINFGELKKIKN